MKEFKGKKVVVEFIFRFLLGYGFNIYKCWREDYLDILFIWLVLFIWFNNLVVFKEWIIKNFNFDVLIYFLKNFLEKVMVYCFLVIDLFYLNFIYFYLFLLDEKGKIIK